MKKLLNLKHWEIFVILIGIPLIIQIIIIFSLIFTKNSLIASYLFPIIIIVFAITFYGWFYILGINLRKRLTPPAALNLKWFKFFVFIPLIYFLLISLMMMSEAFNFLNHERKNADFIGIIFPLHALSTFSTFYCIYFISKALKSVELKRVVTFNDFVGEFFLLWFFPIGIWFIQPRINKIFNE